MSNQFLPTSPKQGLNSPTIAPFGTWASAINAELIVSNNIGFGTIIVDGNTPYWIETRPNEGGRHVIVSINQDNQFWDVIPSNFNARTRVHEYGGGAFTVDQGIVYFCNYDDQQIYRIKPGQNPERLTSNLDKRYAELVFDKTRNSLIAVCESHEANTVNNSLVSLTCDGSNIITTLASGDDFYAFPRLSHDSKKLCWVSWNLPYMPWESTLLWTASFDNQGLLREKTLIAGSSQESIFQPEWGLNNELYFISDRSNWWNLYRWQNQTIEPLLEMPADFARAQWHLGYAQYGIIGSAHIIYSYQQDGLWYLGMLDLAAKSFRQLDCPYTDIWWLKVGNSKIFFRGASPSEPQAIISLSPQDFSYQTLCRSTNIPLSPEWLSKPEIVHFSAPDGASVQAFYYPPTNPNYIAPSQEKPPLIVKCHGGPTGSAASLLNLEIQFWTSRGYAIVDVNYRGSVGFGRAYRQALDGQWGIFDVEDCVQAGLYLASSGLADQERLLISGGSAGGYTVLCALTFTNVFRAGASYYGISDLESMVCDTHKFESRNLDTLVALYPEQSKIYRERSPLYHADQLNSPIIFFQGLEDKIVPPNQAEMMVNALLEKGIPVAYRTFAQEQHGFRRAETIRTCLEGELYFYSKILRLELPDQLEPIKICNLD